MSEYLYEMEVVNAEGKKIILKTNDQAEYARWIEEYKKPSPQKESKRILLKG